MKFMETYLGYMVNVDQIDYITHKENPSGRYESVFYTKNGDCFDFLESINKFTLDDGKDCMFTCDCVITLNKIAILYIMEYFKTYNFLEYQKLEDDTWDLFVKEYKNKIEQITKND
jgi:hypothetical protein